MSSNEPLQRDDVTTEPEAPETASSPETEQPTAPDTAENAPTDSPQSEAPQHAAANGEELREVPADAPQPPPESAPAETQVAAQTQSPVTAAPVSSQEAPSYAAPPTPPPSSPAPADAGSETPAPQDNSSAASETSRPRPQLNPTVDPSLAKPVPTLDTPPSSETPPQPTEEAAAVPEVLEAPPEAPKPQPAPPSAQHVPHSEPAEIPKPEDLDADLEAQISQALASDEAAGSQPVPAAQAPSEAAEGAEAAPAPTTEEELEPGHRLQGKVQSISGDDVFFDVGFRSPGLVSLRQFDPAKTLEVGQQFQIVVEKVNPAEGLIHANLPRGRRKVQGNWDAVEAGQVVDCMVTKTNKGGLEITVSSLRGFLPASQVDMHYVPDLEKYVGQKLTVKITEANRSKRNLIVSRRAYLQEERESQAQEVWGSLEVGQEKKGTVKTIKDYGAFVDIGGVDGFLHIGEISWTRIRHPSDVLSEGQEIDVQIVSLDQERQRIGLGMRQLTQNPWDNATQKYAQGTAVGGRVTRTTDFGAFVELEPGVEGLVHISELDYRRVNKVTDVLNVGDEVEMQVLDLDLGRKRISLSLKALKEKPPEFDKKPEKKSDEDMAPSSGEAYNRKRKGPLKGGTGGSSGGGLFGNPGDFS